jgi:hypothetical protein
VDPNDDPEVRIRELEHSLSDVASNSELIPAAPTAGTSGFGGKKMALLGLAIGLVALGAGVAVGIARHSGGSSGTGATGSPPSAPASQPLQRLYHVLPRGYSSANCSPASSPNHQALSTVECKKTSDPASPAYATFSLYPDPTALDKAFQDGISEDVVTPCPNGGHSPGVWQDDAQPNVNAGAVLCGTYDKGPDLLWTQNKDLLLGDMQGPDLNALYKFWASL